MAKKKELLTKRLVIDGFNLIYKFETLHTFMRHSELKRAMDGLVEILNKYQKKSGKHIHIVYDGKKEEGVNTRTENRGKIKITFSLDQTADTVIMDFIKQTRSPGDYTVVTSDKQVLSFVHRHKAHFFLSENFETLISETLTKPENPLPDPKEKPDIENLSPEELSFWESLFTKQQK
ncbi:MAG: NYN domain-containing protein [Spirochaetes bacterium]|nr:NYN domain-containing protein [Spirochaetota bacterium]